MLSILNIIEVKTYLKIFLSQLRATAHFHFLLQWDIKGLLYHIHHGIPAAGVHHPLLDWHRVSRHGVDEHCKRISIFRHDDKHSLTITLLVVPLVCVLEPKEVVPGTIFRYLGTQLLSTAVASHHQHNLLLVSV